MHQCKERETDINIQFFDIYTEYVHVEYNWKKNLSSVTVLLHVYIMNSIFYQSNFTQKTGKKVKEHLGSSV